MSQKGHITGMAGEFFVMEKLFRKEHEASLTLGTAKTVDIFTKSPTSEKLYEVSVKAMRGGGKWGIGKENYSDSKKYSKLVFVLLYYRNFSVIDSLPDVWIIPAMEAEKIKKPWHDQYGIYYYKKYRHLLEKYKDAWNFLD